MARLGRRYLSAHDGHEEKYLTPQARPNVLFEAGMAFGKYPDRTVICVLGATRKFSDIEGRHVVHLSNKPESRQKLADRLKTAKCLVKTEHKSDWLHSGDFDSALHNPDIRDGNNPFRLKLVKRWANCDEHATYKRKVWMHIRNDGDDCLAISHSGWKAMSGGMRAKIVSSTLQLKLGGTWCPEKQGVDRLHLPPGEMMQTWIDVGSYSPDEIERRCEAETPIGTLVLLVSGTEVELPV
ncbi:hypothetical protein SBA4_1620002 [Candidatus Sulfopaludibacter sp. SbA4]|nr:hypothetical protein SBA4_1620002 [Candidatus Sulfopaludibacter sp. SbA4]